MGRILGQQQKGSRPKHRGDGVCLGRQVGRQVGEWVVGNDVEIRHGMHTGGRVITEATTLHLLG